MGPKFCLVLNWIRCSGAKNFGHLSEPPTSGVLVGAPKCFLHFFATFPEDFSGWYTHEQQNIVFLIKPKEQAAIQRAYVIMLGTETSPNTQRMDTYGVIIDHYLRTTYTPNRPCMIYSHCLGLRICWFDFGNLQIVTTHFFQNTKKTCCTGRLARTVWGFETSRVFP